LRNSGGFIFQPNLRRGPEVALQQAAQALAALDRAVPRRGHVRLYRLAVQVFMGAFFVTMLDVLFDNVPNVALAEKDDLV